MASYHFLLFISPHAPLEHGAFFLLLQRKFGISGVVSRQHGGRGLLAKLIGMVCKLGRYLRRLLHPSLSHTSLFDESSPFTNALDTEPLTGGG